MVPVWARFPSRPAVRLTITLSILAAAVLATTGSALPHGLAHTGPKVEVEGILEHLHEDWPTGSRDLYFLETTGGERLSLHLAADPPGHLLTGHRIRVRGIRMGQTFMQEPGTSVQLLDLGGTSTTVTSATSSTVLPNTFGARRTLVILVNFQDNATQ